METGISLEVKPYSKGFLCCYRRKKVAEMGILFATTAEKHMQSGSWVFSCTAYTKMMGKVGGIDLSGGVLIGG